MSLLAITARTAKVGYDQGIDIDALEVLVNEGQFGAGTEVVGQSVERKVGHVLTHLESEMNFAAKCFFNKKPAKSYDEVMN